MLGTILTIGNEVVSGDVSNTNATWLAQRLESLGVRIVLTAAVPDEIEAIADFVRRERGRVDRLIVTGGLGGTPDDITREALAAAFGVSQQEVPELAADLRSRFPGHPDYAARWARLPAGSRPLTNPRGGAPGFLIENVWVLPGLPPEMEAMFDHYAEELRGEEPIAAWRRAFATRESEIVQVLAGATVRWPQVRIGSYPRFLPEGPEVEIVLKSTDVTALAEAVAWLEPALAAASRPDRPPDRTPRG
jgi:nicotinamide-nucleotide amidase